MMFLRQDKEFEWPRPWRHFYSLTLITFLTLGDILLFIEYYMLFIVIMVLTHSDSFTFILGIQALKFIIRSSIVKLV